MSARSVALLTGGGLLLVGLVAQLLGTTTAFSARTSPASAPVTAVVRNDLGQLKWLATEAKEYTPLELEGRNLYLQIGCTYCHSQHVRPVENETRPWGRVSADPRRWGPASEPGEYAYDVPPTFGSRGIAPDLSRVGLKYSDEWHLAHFWNPPIMTPGSIMGGFSGLFDAPAEPIKIVDEPDGKTLERTPKTEELFDFDSKDVVQLTPNEEGVLFVPLAAHGKRPQIWTPNEEFGGDAVKVVAETRAIASLTAYVQKLGMNRGMWRDLYEPEEVDGSNLELARSDDMIAHGKTVYDRHCISCHGVKGDGNGLAATFLTNQRPRNFTFGVFKFKHTKGALPTDADLLRTITRGVRGSAMPAWFELPLQDRLAVIQYIKYDLAADRTDPQEPYLYFEEEPPGPPIKIGPPPASSAELVAHGRGIWRQAKCWECHGDTGKGDGEKAAGLRDDWGFSIVPANLTRGLFKSGPTVSDIFRTISIGLSGSPMPAFQDAFSEEDRWALSYYILSLSAYTDPLTATPLPVADAARTALNDPKVQTPGPRQAYGAQQIRGSGR